MNQYFAFKDYFNDYFVITDTGIFHYFRLSSNNNKKLYKVKSRLTLESIMHNRDQFSEISETDFLRMIIKRGVVEVE